MLKSRNVFFSPLYQNAALVQNIFQVSNKIINNILVRVTCLTRVLVNPNGFKVNSPLDFFLIFGTSHGCVSYVVDSQYIYKHFLALGSKSDDIKVWVQMSKSDKIAIFTLVSYLTQGGGFKSTQDKKLTQWPP